MRASLITLVVLLAPTLAAQAPAVHGFEVASVRANRSGQPVQIGPVVQPGGRVFAVNRPLRELIRVAYGLEENQLIAAHQLVDANFDLEARAGADTTPQQAALMLRTLLTNRFGLKSHTEKRELPVFRLVRDGGRPLGTQLRRAGPDCAATTLPRLAEGVPPPPPPPPQIAGKPLAPERVMFNCDSIFFSGHLSLRGVTMGTFAMVLSRLVRRTVLDQTELSGVFDIDVTYAPSGVEAVPPPVAGGPLGGDSQPGPAFAQRDGPQLSTAVREQLGLRLESDRAPVAVLVVDDVRQPTEN